MADSRKPPPRSTRESRDTKAHRNKRDSRVDSVPPSSRPVPSSRPTHRNLRKRAAADRGASTRPPPDLTRRIHELETALKREREERAADADAMGEMLARVTQSELETEKAQLRAAQLAARVTTLEADATFARRNDAERAPAIDDSKAQARVAALEAERDALLQERERMHASLATMRAHAARIGAGVESMRELMAASAQLFDELEQREIAVAEIRARSLREARALFARAAERGTDAGKPPPPPPPLPRPHVIEDLSDAAVLLEEEVRRSLRPPTE